MTKSQDLLCPVCQNATQLFDVVDFNKSCNDPVASRAGLSGVPIYYSRCQDCGFIFAPECYQWSKEEFARRIYNSDYVLVDPDFLTIRPLANAHLIEQIYGNQKKQLIHLDYGGGEGLLSKTLQSNGWNSTSIDPYFDYQIFLEKNSVDLITSFEVFEHSPNIHELCFKLSDLLKPNGVILFTTLLSDNEVSEGQRLHWWYAAPRNGHISLFSKKSLEFLAEKYNFKLISYSQNLHSLHRKL